MKNLLFLPILLFSGCIVQFRADTLMLGCAGGWEQYRTSVEWCEKIDNENVCVATVEENETKCLNYIMSSCLYRYSYETDCKYYIQYMNARYPWY